MVEKYKGNIEYERLSGQEKHDDKPFGIIDPVFSEAQKVTECRNRQNQQNSKCEMFAKPIDDVPEIGNKTFEIYVGR